MKNWLANFQQKPLLAADDGKAWHLEAVVKAIGRSQGVIEFNIEGIVVDVNENFLSVIGYTRGEVVGQHHRMFMPLEERQSERYRKFWERLRSGEFVSGEFERIAKGNQTIWLQASYNPLLEKDGNIYRIIKFASDITAEKTRSLDFSGQIAAIDRSQAEIQFTLDGTILNANQNFLDTLGYREDEIIGQHHSMFCDPEYTETAEYEEFWESLRSGQYSAREFKRRHRDGHDVWIQASYNPILDADEKPWKVVKFATDITEQVMRREVANRLSLVADNTDNSVIITNVEREIEYVNAGFERMTG